jgi:hypothetical protein
MKLILAVFAWVLFFTSNISAQKVNDTVTYFGTIKPQDNPAFTYKVRFVVNAQDSLVGFSICDVGGETETKSRIEGYFNRKKDSIYFKEVKVLRTKMPASEVDFCLVNAKVKYKKSRTRRSIWGTFEGTLENGSVCAAGKLDIMELSNVLKRIDKLSKKHDAKVVHNFNEVQQFAGDTVFVDVADDIMRLQLQSATDSTKINFELALNKKVQPVQNGVSEFTLGKGDNIIEVNILKEIQEETSILIKGKRTMQSVVLPNNLPAGKIILLLRKTY